MTDVDLVFYSEFILRSSQDLKFTHYSDNIIMRYFFRWIAANRFNLFQSVIFAWLKFREPKFEPNKFNKN